MANSPQARKRARNSQQRRRRNASQRSLFRTLIKKVLAAVEADDLEAARLAYARAVPVIDRAARQNLVHRNKAARYKSRLNARIKAIGAAPDAEAATPASEETAEA